jgi:hypothetical protein
MGGFTAAQPGNPHIASGYISCAIQIGVKGMTTGTTFKEAPMAGSVPAMTSITFLTGVMGSDVHHSDPFQGSFVLQEHLQFPEGPLMHPPIK